jgi:hypothetical protein
VYFPMWTGKIVTIKPNVPITRITLLFHRGTPEFVVGIVGFLAVDAIVHTSSSMGSMMWISLHLSGTAHQNGLSPGSTNFMVVSL